MTPTPFARTPWRIRAAETVNEVCPFAWVASAWMYRNRGVIFAFIIVLALCLAAGADW